MADGWNDAACCSDWFRVQARMSGKVLRMQPAVIDWQSAQVLIRGKRAFGGSSPAHQEHNAVVIGFGCLFASLPPLHDGCLARQRGG